jgi:hypothetical protein
MVIIFFAGEGWVITGLVAALTKAGCVDLLR